MPYPSSSAASDVWSLRDNYKAEAGGGAGYFGSATPNRGKGGNGGSGVVIIKYPDFLNEATATTGSPTVTNTGGYRIYKFTSSGTITFT
jgi:hypothetical protein